MSISFDRGRRKLTIVRAVPATASTAAAAGAQRLARHDLIPSGRIDVGRFARGDRGRMQRSDVFAEVLDVSHYELRVGHVKSVRRRYYLFV